MPLSPLRRILLARAVVGSAGLVAATVVPGLHSRAGVLTICGAAVLSSVLAWPFEHPPGQFSAGIVVLDLLLVSAGYALHPAAGIEAAFAWPIILYCFLCGRGRTIYAAVAVTGAFFGVHAGARPDQLGRGIATSGVVLAVGWMVSSVCSAHHESAAALERKTTQMHRLCRVATRMAAVNEPDGLLRLYLDAARELAEADSAGFVSVNEGMCEIIAGSGLPEWLIGYRYPLGKGVTGRVVRNDCSVLLNDYGSQSEAHPLFKLLGYTGVMTVPLPKSAPIVGALSVGRRLSRRPFSQADVELVEALAGHAAAALQRGSTLAEERRLRRELEELNHLKDEFLTVVSHELRTPLTVLTGVLQTLELRGPRIGTTLQGDLLRRARNQADRLHRLIVRLLDLSRVSNGHRPRPRAVDLRSVVDLAIDGSRAAETCDRQVEDLTVMADPDDLELAIRNLVENAAKYGGGCVRVHGRRSGARALISVEDDGPGVAPGDEQRLFDRFFRGTKSHGEPGLGVGLALVKESVERMDGSVWYERREEGGSRFVVSLRLVPENAPTTADPRAAVGTGG